MGTKYANISSGTVFGKWTVVSVPFTDQNGRAKAKVRCECGNEADAFLYKLVKKLSTQCRRCSSGKSPTFGSLANKVLRSAASLNATVSISPETLSQSFSLQSGSCVITGEQLSALNSSPARWDNSFGYTPENTVLVSSTAKAMLSGAKMDVKHFIGMVAHQAPTYTSVQDFLNKRETQ